MPQQFALALSQTAEVFRETQNPLDQRLFLGGALAVLPLAAGLRVGAALAVGALAPAALVAVGVAFAVAAFGVPASPLAVAREPEAVLVMSATPAR